MFLLLVRRVVLFLALPVTLVLVWWFASAGSTDFTSPPLATIVDVFPKTWFEGRIGPRRCPEPDPAGDGVQPTLALVGGVALGVLIGSNRVLRAVLEAGARVPSGG
jgi:ABC-type nitrate/sulfonate/bicarbonate transport system permease component